MSYSKGLMTVLVALLVTGCASFDVSQVSEIEKASTKPPATVSAVATNEDRLYPVLYGTTRRPTATGYSDQRDSQVHYGQVFVKIPKGHVTGSLGEKPLWPWRNNTKLTVQTVSSLPSQEAFVQLMEQGLKNIKPSGTGYILVFIHGFNNTFDDAAIRAAQIGADLDVPENGMLFFSWAARHSVDQYTVDEATVDASETHLRAFLRTVMQGAGPRQVHVIAHSMGNRAFLRTVVASLESISEEQRIKFGQIILAAADVDRDLFAQLAPSYLKVAERTTIYLSPYDYAVHASELVHRYPRVGCGDAPQVTIGGIDNVVSLIPDDIPAHAYFADALPMLIDIKNLLLRHQPERPAPDWTYANGFWTVGRPDPNALADRLKCKTLNTVRVNAG